MSLETAHSGIPDDRVLESCRGIPSRERMLRGPVAYIECLECIPCNPCEGACPFGAIKIGAVLSDAPVLNEELCVGCGSCIGKCSGLAITVINKAYSPEKASLELPYEYLPVPECGAEVDAVDRRGTAVCKATVNKVRMDTGTCIVTIVFDKEHADSVKSIRI
ncbi:MAG: 4Fe-4S binding protein [Oscillospiraceae bacterium]|nr:4Fe-4S binding protein [Oscillospiraceae bacterium]